MHHPSIHAEIARQSHVEALRAARRTHEHRQDEDVSELYTMTERVVARLVSRLTPELSVTLPLATVQARRTLHAGS
jgi:hypothetical protein